MIHGWEKRLGFKKLINKWKEHENTQNNSCFSESDGIKDDKDDDHNSNKNSCHRIEYIGNSYLKMLICNWSGRNLMCWPSPQLMTSVISYIRYDLEAKHTNSFSRVKIDLWIRSDSNSDRWYSDNKELRCIFWISMKLPHSH